MWVVESENQHVEEVLKRVLIWASPAGGIQKTAGWWHHAHWVLRDWFVGKIWKLMDSVFWPRL